MRPPSISERELKPWSDSGLILRVASAVTLALALCSVPASAADRWSRTYGGPGTYEGILDLRELADGSIIVAGHTDSFGAQTGDAWWIQLDANGGVLEERVYGNALPGGAAAIAIDPDGGMAVVGAHTLDIFTDRDAWIHHVDAAGNIDWQWEFDADPGMHSFFAVAATDDGGYIATGSTALASTVPIYAWVVKFDASGDVDWQQRYNGGVAEHANFVTQTLDGGYAIAGWSTSSGAGSTDVWLLKIDAGGGIEWQKTYGGFDQEEATGLIQTADGGYALSAFNNTFPDSGHGAWVLRVDAAGDLLWHAVMGDEWGDFRGISQTGDGDLIATGRVSTPATNDLWAVKLQDSDGAILWQRSYAGALGDWGSHTLELADGDLLIGGIWGWGFPEEDIWLQRTDPTGLISSCGLIADTAIVPTAPPILVQDAVTTASNPAPLPVAVAFLADVSALTVDEKCLATASDLLRGDSNGDGTFVAIADGLFLLNYGFVAGSDEPPCFEAAEADGDSLLNPLVDAVFILNHGFVSGPPPPAPYPDCGSDPDPGTSLGCDSSGCP